MNLCTNPGFEVNTDDWTVTRGVLTRITSDYKYGAACGQFVSALGGGWAYATFTLTAPVKGVYTVSFWVKAPDATIPYFKVLLLNGTDQAWTGVPGDPYYVAGELSADGEWHQYKLIVVTTVTDDLRLEVYSNYSVRPNRTDKIYIDGVMLERISHPLLRAAVL